MGNLLGPTLRPILDFPINRKISAVWFLVLSLMLFAASIPCFSESEDVMEKRFIDFNSSIDEMKYGDYVIKRNMDKDGWEGQVNIFKKDKQVMRFDKCENGSHSNKFDLFDFINKGTKQLIVYQAGTGMRGPEYLWIIDLADNMNVLFSSEEWNIDGGFIYVDIDKNGSYKILGFSKKWDYYQTTHNAAYATTVFSYDKSKKKYVPANDKYIDFTKNKIILDKKDRTANGNEDPLTENAKLTDAIEMFYVYSYAGKLEKAKEYFKAEYNYNNKDAMLKMLMGQLNNDPVFEYVNKEK